MNDEGTGAGTGQSTRTLKVDYLARVEGEGALFVRIRQDRVVDVKLRIFEPPRFFEAFLRGRHFMEVPDITARICGICPVAYQMGAVHAMEHICGVKVEGVLRDLRRLIYCGEWIESHALHIYMLHAPDFLGYPDAIAMAKDHADAVKRGLRMKKCGNTLMTCLGGREIHPINVRVGGFYRVPEKRELKALTDELTWTRDAAVDTVRWVAGFEVPEFEQNYEYVALSHPDEYPFNEGRLVSSRGLDIDIHDFDHHFVEEHVEHSTALHCVRPRTGAYMVGPLARFNLNLPKLTPMAGQLARDVGLGDGCHNPFKSIVVRSIETVFACEEALRIVDGYERPRQPCIDVVPRSGAGCGCTEAPRGVCHHHYRIDAKGIVVDARIVPPTSQNQRRMEADLREFVQTRLDLPSDRLQWLCEQAIRNYDPCISCSVHALKLHILRD